MNEEETEVNSVQETTTQKTTNQENSQLDIDIDLDISSSNSNFLTTTPLDVLHKQVLESLRELENNETKEEQDTISDSTNSFSSIESYEIQKKGN